jgi:hypothetical protein
MFIDMDNFIESSYLYNRFINEKKEIKKIQEFESKKRGFDVSYNAAYLIWTMKYKQNWYREYSTSYCAASGLQ